MNIKSVRYVALVIVRTQRIKVNEIRRRGLEGVNCFWKMALFTLVNEKITIAMVRVG